MPDQLPDVLRDIHHVLPSHWAGLVITAVSVLCGGLIGYDRERAEKPAGMRTLVLICLGSAIFTQASLFIGGVGTDHSRMAAQIVSGIGFLGAGAIIQRRGRVIGVTTGAAIWATAAVGVVIGSGQVAGGAAFAIVVYLTLAAANHVEPIFVGKCKLASASLNFDPRNGKTRVRIQHIVDRYVTHATVEFVGGDDAESATVRYCKAHRDHTKVLNDLAMLKSVTRIAHRH